MQMYERKKTFDFFVIVYNCVSDKIVIDFSNWFNCFLIEKKKEEQKSMKTTIWTWKLLGYCLFEVCTPSPVELYKN